MNNISVLSKRIMLLSLA